MEIDDLLKNIYVIHSPKLTERRQGLTRDLQKHAIMATWIEDFEPDQIGMGLLIRRWRNFRLRLAEISVYLKQEAVYRDMVAKGVDVALVLEDDAILGDDFKKRLSDYLMHLPADFDVVFLGESCGAHLPLTDNSHFARASSCRSVSGYLVTQNCAGLFCKYLGRIDQPIDLKLNVIIATHGLNAYWSEPPLLGNGSEQGIYKHSLGIPWRQIV